MDRLKEALLLSDMSATSLLHHFMDVLSPKTQTSRRFREPVSLPSTYTEGQRPRASKRPRTTASSAAALKQTLQNFEELLNSVYPEEAVIRVENKVDLECKWHSIFAFQFFHKVLQQTFSRSKTI